jgi:hypothetical protein
MAGNGSARTRAWRVPYPAMPPQIAHILFWASVLACAVGQGALLWAAVRRLEAGTAAYDDDRRTGERRTAERWSPDRRNEHPFPVDATDSRWRELAWAFLPGAGLALLLAATWSALP